MTNENARNGAGSAGTAWLAAKEESRGGSGSVRSYYAVSVEEAMSAARAVIGPDAILLRSRKAPLEMRHRGAYEVVFSLSGAMPPARGEGSNHSPAPKHSELQLAGELSIHYKKGNSEAVMLTLGVVSTLPSL